jgi:hypothetical protein
MVVHADGEQILRGHDRRNFLDAAQSTGSTAPWPCECLTCSCCAKGSEAMSSCATAKPHAAAAWVRCSVPISRRPYNSRPSTDEAEGHGQVWHPHYVRRTQRKFSEGSSLRSHVAIALGSAQHNRKLRRLSQSPHTLTGGAIGWLCKCCLYGCGGLKHGAQGILNACSRHIWRRCIIRRSRPEQRRLDTVAGLKAAQQPSSKRCQLRAGACCVSC